MKQRRRLLTDQWQRREDTFQGDIPIVGSFNITRKRDKKNEKIAGTLMLNELYAI